ncbi:MAG TPA: hypothetical protein VH437_23785 [Terriglobales bacterium]|jgi:hypothetical protein
MLTKLSGLFVVCLLYAGVSSAQAAEPSHEHPSGVKGTVVYASDHMVIRNPFVVAHKDGSETVRVAQGGDDGYYSLELTPGIYDVCVMARASSPTCRKIEVTPDGMMIFNAVLEFSSVGMQDN